MSQDTTTKTPTISEMLRDHNVSALRATEWTDKQREALAEAAVAAFVAEEREETKEAIALARKEDAIWKASVASFLSDLPNARLAEMIKGKTKATVGASRIGQYKVYGRLIVKHDLSDEQMRVLRQNVGTDTAKQMLQVLTAAEKAGRSISADEVDALADERKRSHAEYMSKKAAQASKVLAQAQADAANVEKSTDGTMIRWSKKPENWGGQILTVLGEIADKIGDVRFSAETLEQIVKRDLLAKVQAGLVEYVEPTGAGAPTGDKAEEADQAAALAETA